MSSTNHDPVNESTDAIRIVGINTDKTRRAASSEYHVYFLLSGTPAAAWRVSFLDEWRGLRPSSATAWPETGVDGPFLWITCRLSDVPTLYLPVLKKAVAAANGSYRRHMQEEAAARTSRENVWRDERGSVEEMAASLNFE